MTSVCDRPHYKGLFEDQSNLQSICEKVIVPNMEFRGMTVVYHRCKLTRTFLKFLWCNHVCYSVTFPFPDADEEEFEDNPEEYIRRDIEGSGKKIVFMILLKIIQ